ncbi:MAG: HNH endonuclease [Syntrophobacterales bacterium]|nr:MAG: HNH endonuclease [Syntrophobacterales bacterium]
MERALLLNATYEPLKVVSWRKAIIMLTLGKVEVIETYDRVIHGVSFSIKLPSVIRLIKFIKRRPTSIKFSRQNIYLRDKGMCQYCGENYYRDQVTYDHVVPRSKGGLTDWANIVTCCRACNRRKGGRTPKEAGMRLIRPPKKPPWPPILTITIGIQETPVSWRPYLYWSVSVES